jgi:hypothetical protein
MTLARSSGASLTTRGAGGSSDSCIVGGRLRRDNRLGLISSLLRPPVRGGGRTIKAEFAQKATHLFEGNEGRPGGSEHHAGATRAIEHPRGNHGGRVVGDAADEHDLSSAPHLPILNVNVSAAGRMPRVMEPRAKRDTGGITLDW